MIEHTGTPIQVESQVRGDAVDGNDPWDRIEGGLISDRFVSFDVGEVPVLSAAEHGSQSLARPTHEIMRRHPRIAVAVVLVALLAMPPLAAAAIPGQLSRPT